MYCSMKDVLLLYKDMEVIFKIYQRWCLISDKIRFLLVGGFNTCVSYLIFIISLHLFGEAHYQLSVALQWSISSVFSYINQKFFVFCTKGNYLKEYFKCCTTWVISYTCNALMIELFVRYLNINVYLAQIMAVLIASVLTYILFKYFAFKKEKSDF